MTRICARAFAALTLEQAIAALDAAGVACGRVNYPEELIAHPQLAARQRWREVASPVGMLRALLPPPVSAGWEAPMDRIPGVGDDTRAILMALGCDDGEIGRLILDGIVSEPASTGRLTTMDLSLTPALRDFQDEVRTWLHEHLVGEFARYRGVGFSWDDQAWDVRVAWDKELSAGGWLCLGWPREYGGRAASVDEQLIFQIEYARENPPYRATVQGQDLLGPTILAFGSPEQKSRFLPRIVAVEELWGQGFSEPGAGSDLAGLRTSARLEDDEWVIDGQKVWTSTGVHADWLYVLCRTDPQAPRHRGISLLLIPAGQPGVDIRPIRNILGGAEFCEVFFSDARTAADMVVGPVNGGWGVAMGTLGAERGTTLLAEHLRIKREVDEMIDAARAGGRSPHAVLRRDMVRAWTDARIMEWNALRLMTAIKGHGIDPVTQASISKVFASGAHIRMGETAMRAEGARSEIVGDGYELDRLQQAFLASRAESIYGGTTQIQLNTLAERVLGLPREPRRS